MAQHRLQQLLQDILRKQCYRKNNYDMKLKEMTTGGANYTSNLFKIEVSVPTNNKRHMYFFVKMACPSVKMRKCLDEYKIYSTEQFFYTKLANIYKTIEEENDVPNEHRLVFPKCYGYNPTVNEEILVLEDLSAKYWLDYDRFKSIDWSFASAAFTELGKFHALSFAYSEKDPDEYEQVLRDLKKPFNADSLSAVVKNATSVALHNVRLEYKEVLSKYLDNFELNLTKLGDPIGRNVIAHGDYRPSNLMYKFNWGHMWTQLKKIFDTPNFPVPLSPSQNLMRETLEFLKKM